MLSHATLSQATLSHATLSQATLSHATLSQAMLSQSKLSQAGGGWTQGASAGWCGTGERRAAVLTERLRRPDDERLDLIWAEVRPELQKERDGAGHHRCRHRCSAEAEVSRSIRRNDDAVREQRVQGTPRNADRDDPPPGCDEIGLGVRVGAAPR